MSTTVSKRQCNLDLLRIAAMFLIVLLHSVDHSGVLEAVTDQGNLLSSIYVYFIYSLTQICVNCYNSPQWLLPCEIPL